MNGNDPAISTPSETAVDVAPLIRVVNTDRATLELLKEWLGAAGYRTADNAADGAPRDEAALAIVDVPFTRHGAIELLRGVAAQYPGTPVLALSATFFSNVKCGGDCARALGVAGVLPKPVARDALVAAVKGLVRLGK